MSEYVLNRAILLAPNGRLEWRQLWHNWQVRRRVTRLMDRDDRLLDDMGVTREEIQWAAQLPITINSAIALQERSSKRRRREQILQVE
jgi:uncharacterized protein YjiS (DUF1127 family)